MTMRSITATAVACHGRSVLAAILVITCWAMSGCGDEEREPLFSTASGHQGETERQTILAEIAQLANAKTESSDAQASKTYDQAKTALIARGSSVENDLCEAVVANQDWGVRLGCVEVLESVGTKVCVPTIIIALDDPEGVVALYANHLLVALCKHDEIPVADAKPGVNGLPPLPKKVGKDAAIDADMKRWSAWHQVNHAALRKAWEAWWSLNKDQVKID